LNLSAQPSVKRGAASRIASLFPRVELIKDSVLESLRALRYNVEDLYKTTGYAQWLSRSTHFKNFMLLFIALNTIWIGIEADNNHADLLLKAAPIFQLVDNVFCFIFTFEIAVRFAAFECKIDALKDPWFMFDGSLVTLMVWETWIMSMLYLVEGIEYGGRTAQGSQVLRMVRLVRLVRVARTTRLVSACPELIIITKGLFAGLRSVFAVLVMLLVIIYVFAIIFTMTLTGSQVGEGLFDNVPQSMNTLLLQVLCGPDTDFMRSLLAASWVHYIIELTYLFIALQTLMNMLIGTLCHVMSTVSEESNEAAFTTEVEHQLGRLATVLDQDQSGGISKEEFDVLINDPQMTSSFNDLGVDIVGVADFAKFIFEQCDEISYVDFGKLVGHFRGTKAATIKDVMDMRRYVTMELLSLEARFAHIS
jgi:uncharacterized membrane protein